MTHWKKLLMAGGLAVLAALLFAPMASAQRARVFVGGGWGPGWGWYNPYYGPYPYPPNAGEVKIENSGLFKNDAVYVDGGYIGLVKKNKDFPLANGDHTVELRDAGGQVVFQQNVQVIPGRTTDVYPATVQPR
jgi:hypothetical protein